MINLIRNENMKIYFRLRTWILIVILLGVVYLMSVTMYQLRSANSGWESLVQLQIEQNQRWLNDPQVTAEMKIEAEQQIKIQQYRLDHHIPPLEMADTPWTTIKQSASLTVIITIFTIIIAADMVAGEFAWGTIKLLLIRPWSRSKILLSKYVATLLYALAMMGTLFSSAFLLNAAFYRFQHIGYTNLIIDHSGNVQETSVVYEVLAAYGLRSIELLIIATMAFMLSTVFRSSTLAVGFTMFAAFTGQIITLLLSRYSWGKYWLFANTDLTVYAQGNPPLPGMSLGFSIGVLSTYYIVFMAIAWIVFSRRDVAV